MNFEVGDMIVCAYDYGIILKVEDPRVTISWYEKGSNDKPNTSKYFIDNLESAIDGKHNKLIKAK
jgi:hypothetical protein